MTDENLNLIQKLAKIRAISDVAQKNKKGFNYTYADITAILANVTAGMKKYRVSLIPSIVPGTSVVEKLEITSTKFDKTGKMYNNTTTEMLYKAEMIFKWVNDDDTNDYIEVPWFVTGSQSDPSQALGSGLTYCTRYFLTSYFQIAQPDSDPDAYRSKQKAAEESENKAITEQIIHEVDLVVKKFLVDNEAKGEEVKKFISKYAKGGNYFAIKEPEIASKLLVEFKNKYVD